MVLKSLSRRGGTRQLLNYLFEKKEKLVGEKQKPILIRHNVRARTLDKWVKEFDHNESYRLHRRKDNVKVYHTILSFSHKDREHINEKLLRSVAKQYMKLRGENNLFIGTAHFDKSHVHLHLVHSGTKYLTGESNRLSRKEFHELKLAIDRYQQEKFPELVNSLPRHGKSRAASKMHEIERLNTRESEKQELLQTIEENYTKAKSLDEFLSLVAAQGHEPYFRNGRLQGIKFEGNRKFRLNRLGYDKEKLAELGVRTVKEQMELEELRNLRISRSVERDQSSERSIARVEQEIEEKDNERDHEDENGRQSEVDNTDEKEEDTDSENENNNEEGETEDGDESEYGDDDSLP